MSAAGMNAIAKPQRSASSASAGEIVLDVADLAVQFQSRDGDYFPAVDGLSFALRRGETLGIVGESGCGKSVTALSVMRLLPKGARIASGAIRFNGADLARADEAQMRRLRGNDIGMIFQEPMTSLNPVLKIGRQLAETVRLHRKVSRQEARRRAIEMLRLVRIPDPERRMEEYPHQLSGGMRQRVMIAIALSCDPKVLIADEPTTALDVTIQAQIIDLMLELKDKLGTTIMLITHDLGVVAQTCERVVVMYAGRKVEETTTRELFARPLHPYTRGLLASMPRLSRESEQSAARLNEIPGMVPAPGAIKSGCAFAPRCAFAQERCRLQAPVLREFGDDHVVACWEAERVAA
jgi:peptide/nickel transport system ATP-binding protein